MTETDIDPGSEAETAALEKSARDMDRDRMKQIGSLHFAMAAGALTLWGAALTWAQVTGWGIASAAAIAGALVAGSVIPPIVHEWGHFAAARLAGAVSPVFERPKRHFFMFDFPLDKNDTRQFTWMSWGGILAPWGPVVLIAAFVPLAEISSVALLATLLSKAVFIAAFEVPVVLRTSRSGDPAGELGKRVAEGGLSTSTRVGQTAGLACFVLVLVAGWQAGS
jgi:hypothetical protein